MCERTGDLPKAICPVCLSSDVIEIDGSQTRMKCTRCGYAGERDLFWTRTNE
ncbi:MAG: hypothetical protein QXX77_03125 [Candidatus Methanosuratincola sp.]